jgi:nucleoside-diphosphate-sugar epimerase
MNKLDSIDVWGDGEQTRSFLYIDDCISGTKKVFESNYSEVFNVGSEEQVSINQMISMIEDIAEYKIKKNFQLDKPKGVRGRSSDNTLIENKINWRPGYNLRQGLKETYKWIYDELKSGSNIQKFTRK